MRILFLGDVMGRAGRAAVADRLPGLRKDWALDFVVVNGENASSGAGLTGEHAKALLAAGADCITLGDHAFDQKDMLAFIERKAPESEVRSAAEVLGARLKNLRFGD